MMKFLDFIRYESAGHGKAVDDAFRANRIRVLVAITFGYGFIYTCRLGLGVVKKPLIDAGIYTPAELGIIGASLFYAYAIGKLTNGFLVDHLRIRPFIVAGFVLTAACNLAMGMTEALVVAVAVWTFNGWFQSFGAPACVVSMTAWFSNSERGRAYGIWSASHSIGEGMTFFVVGFAVAYFGWRAGFVVPSIIGAVTALGMYLLIPGKPTDIGLPAVADWRDDRYGAAVAKATGRNLLSVQLSVMRNPAIWILAMSSALAYVSRYAIVSWGVLYLEVAKGFSLTVSTTLLMLSTVSGAVGAIVFGFVSDGWCAGRRPPANLIFGLVEILGLCLMFYGPANLYVMGAGMLLFGLGMTGLVTSLGGLFAVDIAPKHVAGAAMGFIGVFSYLGSALQEMVSGWLIGLQVTPDRALQPSDFDVVVLFWLGASIASMLLAACLWRVRLQD